MNSIHFHFNGDVNINVSLPDEVDSIVMVMRPDKTPEVMQETQCWDEIESKGDYDCLEVVPDDGLGIDGDGVSLSAEDVTPAVVCFADHTMTLCADGRDFATTRERGNEICRRKSETGQ